MFFISYTCGETSDTRLALALLYTRVLRDTKKTRVVNF